MCVALQNSGDFKHDCFLPVLQIPFKCQNMYLYLHFVSVFLLLYWLHFATAFLLSLSLRPVLMVPGYSQVSGRRKDLFCCLGSPVSVGSQGKGWGGSTAHLCLGLVWPNSHVSTLRSTALPCYGTLSTLCAMTFDVPFHYKPVPFAL